MDQVVSETQNQQMRMAAELEDLCQTKNNLEERLIELIRYVRCIVGLINDSQWNPMSLVAKVL